MGKEEIILNKKEIFQQTVKISDKLNAGSSLFVESSLELDYVVKGNGLCCVLDQAMPCKQGEVFVIESHIPHGFFLNSPDETLVVRRMLFTLDDWFDETVSTDDVPRYCFGTFGDGATVAYANLTKDAQKDVVRYLNVIESESNAKRFEWQEVVKSNLTSLLITVGRCVNDAIKNDPVLPQRESSLVKAAVRVTKERFAESNLTLDSISNALFVSQSYLSRLFQIYVGEPFSDFLRSYRIEMACKKLIETDDTVSDIVLACGLKDLPTFYRAFSKAKGMTPNIFRNKNKKSSEIKEKIGEKTMSILNEISANLQAGKAKVVKELVQQALDEGVSCKEVLEQGLLAGMNVVGEKFRNNEIYIPEVLVAARALNMGTQVLKPYFAAGENKLVGKVCIGTVQGDLHDIGKNLVKMMMEGKQLEVVDLGTDVPPEEYVKAVTEQGCQVICCSALLTTTMEVMRKVVEKVTEAGLRDKVKIMIGGAPVNEEFCREIGADVYTVDAASAAEAAVELCGVLNAQ